MPLTKLNGCKLIEHLCSNYPSLVKTQKCLISKFGGVFSSRKYVIADQIHIVSALLKAIQVIYVSAVDAPTNVGIIYTGSIMKENGSEFNRCILGQIFVPTSTIKPELISFTNNPSQNSQILIENENQIACLCPILVNIWIDSRESVFGSLNLNNSQNFILCCMVIKTLAILVPHMQPNESKTYFALIDKHVTSCFPFGKGLFCRDIAVVNQLTDSNLAYAEMLLELIPQFPKSSSNVIKKVSNYILDLFNLRLTSNQLDNGLLITQKLLKYDKSPNSLLFPALVQLQDIDTDTSFKVFRRLSSMVIAEDLRCFSAGKMMILSNHLEQELNWILTLPKHLWQLKNKNLKYSESIIRFLSELVKFGESKITEKIVTFIIPLFAAEVQSNDTPERIIYGPFVNYPLVLQKLLLDMVFYLPWSNPLLKSIIITSHCMNI
jgi:hypothetical protein